MKRKLLILFAFFGLLLAVSGCRMRYASESRDRIRNRPTNTRRHFGAKKSIWQRKTIWGHKHYGPRPYRHRGWYRQ